MERRVHTVAVALVLTAFGRTSHTLAFSPTPHRIPFGAATIVDHRVGRHHRSSCVFASSEDDTASGSSSEINHNEEEHDEEDDEGGDIDIITQRLRRNASTGPINPMKEHEKMVKENEDEAQANTNLDIKGNSTGAAPSVLYSHMLGSAVDSEFDPAASHDELYVESQMKELLSRKGKDLSRLGPGIATLPLDPATDEAKSENSLAQKELELQRVIEEAKSAASEEWDEFNLEKSQEKQSEILEKARKLQSEIDQLHVDDCGAVLLANLAFYEAFSLKDPETMRDVWWRSPSVLCIHPSHAPLIGSNVVVESFTNMFENGLKEAARMRGEGTSSGAGGGVFMTPTNIRGLSVRGTTASLVCDEEIYSKGSDGESISRQGGLLVNKILTTNIFRKVGGEWKMTHRHASWHPDTTAAQAAMKAEPGIVLYDENATSDTGSKGTKKAEGMTLKKLKGDGTSKRPLGLPSVPSSLEGLDANAILGIPKPKEEEPKPSKGANDGVISKIINLSDLLGGGNDTDGEKNDDKGIGDMLADMIMGSDDSSGSAQTTGSGTPDDPFVTRKVFKIGPDGIENLSSGKPSEGDESSDDEEEQEVVIDLRGKSEEERKEALSAIVDNVIKDAGLPVSSDAESSVLDAQVSQSLPQPDKEGLRQKCIATLRKLSEQGLLSSKQKRILLTDIITSSARGDTSMVEVAYELLCSGEESDCTGETEQATGMEDFTEQCRVFAAMGDDELT